jgi:two-component system chemotaxis response regulator CheB
MDVRMPHMNGLEATEYIMAHHPTPILVLTASLGKQDVDLSFKMLSAGALEIMEKPRDDWEREGRRLRERVKLLSRIKVITHIRGKSRFPSKLSPTDISSELPIPLPEPPPVHVTPTRPHITPRRIDRSDAVTAPLSPDKIVKPGKPTTDKEVMAIRNRNIRLVGIAASTGGPPALSKVLRQIPANFPVPILVVQHIPPGFSNGLADWLNGETELNVKLASEGEVALPGYAYLPADDRHLVIRSDLRMHMDDSATRFGLRPSADVTFESMAVSLPGNVLSIILTGMGRDGSQGMKALRDVGCYNIAQDEATSVIFGMPKSAIELGVIDKILPLHEIPTTLKKIFLD